jgi:subtilisin family serine protease
MVRKLAGFAVVALTLAAGVSVLAQRPASTFPAIVVFKAGVSLEQFRGSYRADAREQADPQGWGYLDRAVVGATMALEVRHGFRADHVFSAALHGFSARLTIAQLSALEQNPLVDYIEADGEMKANAQTTPWGITQIGAPSSPSWNPRPVSVSNVHVYIVDTGIDEGHPDLNVLGNVNFAGGPNTDCNGHGTHVAGTVAAKDNTSDVVGVAPGAPLTGVRVLGCGGSGTTAGVIKGVDWVTANAIRPAVANMSLGGGVSTALDNAVIAAANSGVLFAVAAGNDGANACNSSPARAGAGTNNGVVTVAATDSNNKEASWSNFGPCVDIWAPGVNILSTKRNGGTTTMSGTSMATPHVTGAAALYLFTRGASPAGIETALKSSATTPGTLSKSGSLLSLLNVSTY